MKRKVRKNHDYSKLQNFPFSLKQSQCNAIVFLCYRVEDRSLVLPILAYSEAIRGFCFFFDVSKNLQSSHIEALRLYFHWPFQSEATWWNKQK